MFIEPPKHLSNSDKERFIVEHLDTTDMLLFASCPYDLNTPFKNTHGDHFLTYAYIDLDKHNQEIAISDLRRLNKIILKTNEYNAKKSQLIDTSSIAFCESDTDYMHTHLRFFPYTFTGKIQGNVKDYAQN